jgi:two-component system LytT family response regulator
MKTIIIEDEVIAAQALETLVNELYPDIAVLTVLQSVEESVEWIQANPMPDLMFMDIHLADDSSFSIFNRVKITCPIIFTTAYNEYALKAFQVNSIDYLLKPINKKDLERAIEKYKNLSVKISYNDKSISDLLDSIKKDKTVYKSSFLVSEKDKLIPLAVKDIAYIIIKDKVVTAVTAGNQRKHLDQTLDEIMEQLNPAMFYRANRQFIVSRNAIKDIATWFGNKVAINLIVSTPERIIVSKTKVKEFKKWLTE